MIKKPSNWETVQEMGDFVKLPLGGYVCKVMKTEIVKTQYGEQLLLYFDIAEGEYKGYFRKDYDGSKLEGKKWRGVLRNFLPLNNGDPKDETTKSILKGMVTAFEKSNPGFVWGWDESKLVGKEVGIIFRNEEWEYNGKSGWSVRPFRCTDSENIRNNNYQIPKDRPLQEKTVSNVVELPHSDVNGYVDVSADDELPF